MKKSLTILSIIACLLLCLFGCADVNGLHNQEAAMVTFVFKNMGEGISGEFTIPGNFNNWDNTEVTVKMNGGNGTSTPLVVTAKNIQFTLVTLNYWGRPWFPAVQGNGSDPTASGAMQNFYIDGLDLTAGEITLVIDGSAAIATPVVE